MNDIVKILVVGEIIANKNVTYNILGDDYNIKVWSNLQPEDADIVITGDLHMESLINLSQRAEIHVTKTVTAYKNG